MQIEETEDAGVLRALEKETGHGAPYPDAEVHQVKRLHISYAHNIEALYRYSHFHGLFLMGCEINSVSGIPQLPSLMTFCCQFSSLKSIDPLRAQKSLVKVHIDVTFVEDISPLLDLPLLGDVDVRGCPLSEHSFYEVLPALKAKDNGWLTKDLTPEDRATEEESEWKIRVRHSREEEWKLTRQLHERGFPLSFCRSNNEPYWTFLAAPGLKYFERPEWDLVAMDADTLEAMLEWDDLTMDELLSYEHPTWG